MQLRTAFGVVVLNVWRGKNPANGHWGIPMRERWGLSAHQELSPALEDKLAYFATVAGSYEMAARLACKLGIPIEDSTVRALVQVWALARRSRPKNDSKQCRGKPSQSVRPAGWV